MQKLTGYVTTRRGNAVEGATVEVLTYPAGVLATIYSEDDVASGAIANPLTTDADGFFEYYAANGHYSWVITTDDNESTINDIIHNDSIVNGDIEVGGSIEIDDSLSISGDFALNITITAETNITLPTSGTVAVTDVVQTWTKAQRGAVVALTSSGASIAVDLSLSNNYKHTLTEDTTLAAPTNAVEGQSGIITFTQHASSAKTLAWNAFWKWQDGTDGTISATVDSINTFSYYINPGATSATCSLLPSVS